MVVGMERWGGRRHRAGLAMEKAQCKEKKKGWNKKKKQHAVCVNWLMLPPLCQINSTGQGRERGRENVRGVTVLSPFIKGFFHPPSNLLSPPSFFL